MDPGQRADPPTAGDVLDGRYTLVERIGRGGMAEVFRARDERLGREVAVKLLAPHLVQDAVAARQLVREARAAAAIRHPSIVAVYDTGSDRGTHYLVMELVEGRTLADLLASEGPLAPAAAVGVAVAVADAVQAAHVRGVVHRDLKPSNVLLDVDGRVRVTDFGIAYAAAATMTATAMLAGSAPYLSPEQAQGEEPRPTADVYALGCLLFEMVTGRAPFVGPTAVAVLAAHLQQDPVAPSSLRPDVPALIDAVVARAMAKDPAQRQPDAGAFARELEGTDAVPPTVALPVAASDAELAPTPAPPGTAPVRTDRRPWLWAVGGASAVVLLALVVGALVGGRGEEEPGTAVPPAATIAPSALPSPAAAPSPSLTPSPSPSPSPAPSPSPPPPPVPSPPPATPAEAAAAVRERLEEARRAFEIEEDDAEDLDDRLAEIVREHRKGKDGPEKARAKLDELRAKVDELAEKGGIGTDLHADLRRGLGDLAATL
ncbi:MAG: protein kinase [Actinobacteria bacterium]|nr:protein kinase [Actinomycetota bacterium]